MTVEQWPDGAGFSEHLSRTAIHTIKPDNITTFLGKKLVAQFGGRSYPGFNFCDSEDDALFRAIAHPHPVLFEEDKAAKPACCPNVFASLRDWPLNHVPTLS
jgi:ribosomal protein L27